MPVNRLVNTDELVTMYTVQHLTMDQIGKLVGMTRQAVHKRLRSAGIVAIQGEQVAVMCFACLKVFLKSRSGWAKSSRHFCSEACYGKHMENPEYNPRSLAMAAKRAVIS